MHIHIKNKILTYNNYKTKCAIGKRGINIKKKEGDMITPKGIFKIIGLFYRKDRVGLINTKIKKTVISKNTGWCDDTRSKSYNRLIKFPFKYSAERFYKKESIYDLILVLDFNMNPVRRNRGSAIFIHVAKKNFKPTRGCVAIKKNELKKLITKINKKTKVKIY